MFVLFEEAGKYQAGRVLSEAESSAQVELDSGKRVKVKSANVLLKFEKPSPAELMREAQEIAPSIELDLAWEFAPEYVDELRALAPGPIAHPEKYFAVIAKGDEVLAWREMTARYAGCRIRLLEGGDHALSDFDEHIAEVFGFLGLT